MNNKSMTESELKEFLTALSDNLPNSTENLSKIADKDEWLNEVRGNEGLEEKFKPYVNEWEDTPSESLSNMLAIRLAGSDLIKAKQCAQIAKQYSYSKLSELEKWIDENRMKNEFEDSVYYPELKTKIQTLK